MKHELVIKELYGMLFQVTAWSGKVRLKLASRRETSPSLIRENSLATDVPTDPRSAEALIS